MVNSLTQLTSGAAFNTSQQTSRLSSLMTAAASGTRITRAMDDIASLSAATALSSEISGLRAAAQNVNQASSFLQVADGGAEQIGGILDRLSQLATQANSGALDDNSRAALNTEAQGLLDEIDRLAADTNFNGVPLLDGSLASDTTLRTNATLEAGDVSASGLISDSILVRDTAKAASAQLSFASAADINAGDTISISDGAGGSADFTFVAGAATNVNEIQVGANVEETLENAAAALNAFSGANDEGVSQLNVSIDGNALVFEGQNAGNVVGADGTTAITIATSTGGSLSNGTFNNGSVGGVDASNLTATGFAGQLSGFEATFVGNDSVNASIDVGGETFRASGVSTNSATDQTVTFASQNGGSFDVTFAGGQGETVANGDDADGFASRLDAAFSGVEFTQNREVTNFTAAGSLAGASIEIEASSFDGIEFADAAVLNGRLEVTISGQTYRSSNLGDSVGAGERINLLADNGNEMTLTNGDTRFDISGPAGGSAFADALSEGFGSNVGGAAFQVSAGSDGTLQLGIGDFTREGLGLQNFDLLSASGAQAGFAAVGAAIQTVTSQRADVGAFQQALDFAANNIESAVQNQEAARSVLLDTDFAANSTEMSLLEAAQEASINTLAQTNRLQDNVLKLIQ
jgi:flagellin